MNFRLRLRNTVMSVYLPITATGLGSYLISKLDEEPAPAGVPLYQIEARRVPVISALVPGNPIYRMLSFVTGPRSIPMCRSNEKFSYLSPMRQHNVTHVEYVPFGAVAEKVPSDLYSDCQGTPFEYGYGQLLTLESRYNLPGCGQTLHVGAQYYEVYLVMSQIRSFLQCYPALKLHELTDLDLSIHYEPSDRSSIRRSLLNRETMSIQDIYENVARFLCGSSNYSHGQILTDFTFVQERCLASTKISPPHSMVRYTDFRPHRVVRT